MTTIALQFDNEKLERLQRLANELGETVESAALLGLEEFLSRREEFRKATEYVFQKNDELYRRLAK